MKRAASLDAPAVPSPHRLGLIAALLIVIFLIHSLSESLAKSPTSDEPPHIASGLSYVVTGQIRANPQHPPLLKELSGLSLLIGGIRWPRNPQTEFLLHGNIPKGLQPEWEIGNNIIASNGPDRVLFWARLPFVLVASALAILIYLWGRRLVGELAALCAVFLYTTDPTILAHSFTVTTDVGLATFTVLLLFTLWQYLRKPTLRRLALCGLALGAALCAKFSAVFLLPVVVFLLFAAVIWPAEPGAPRKQTLLDPYYREPIPHAELPRPPQTRRAGLNDPRARTSGKKYEARHGSRREATSLRHRLTQAWTRCAIACLGIAIVAVVVIEALYLFPRDPLLYVHGLGLVNADHNPNYLCYLAGRLQHRFSAYFAIAYLLKEPIAAILLAIIGLSRVWRLTALRRAFLLLPAAAMFTASSLAAEQIGVRYIIPVLPFAHLLGGLALAAGLRAAAKWVRWAAAGLCAWLVLAAAGTYPDHLSYFNEGACLLTEPSRIGIDGGSKCGIFWLDDSNIDWGGGLKQLRAWLDRNARGRPIRYFSIFGFPPLAYGIASARPPIEELTRPPVQGLYVVSAHLVARVPARAQGAAWLRRTPPVAVVGHALYVYDIR